MRKIEPLNLNIYKELSNANYYKVKITPKHKTSLNVKKVKYLNIYLFIYLFKEKYIAANANIL